MTRITIAKAVKMEMEERGLRCIWAGEPDACISAYFRTNGKVEHPLNKIEAVISAIRRSSLFEADGYIRACDSTGLREIRHPCFKLKISNNGK